MKNYKMKPDEVVRYQGTVTLQTKKGPIPANLILTNFNFIFVTVGKKFLWFEPKAKVVAFAKELVKTFKEAPEIKQTGNTVKISFTTEDRIVEFEEKKEARTFVINAWEIVTGKTAFERNLDKLKDALDLIGEKFDINLIELIKGAITNGIYDFTINAIQSKITKFFPKKEKKVKQLTTKQN